jgi:hypothetical protein
LTSNSNIAETVWQKVLVDLWNNKEDEEAGYFNLAIRCLFGVYRSVKQDAVKRLEDKIAEIEQWIQRNGSTHEEVDAIVRDVRTLETAFSKFDEFFTHESNINTLYAYSVSNLIREMQERTELHINDLSGIKEARRTYPDVEVAQVGQLTPRAIRDGDSTGRSTPYGSGKSIADTIRSRRQASGYYPTNDSELAAATRAPGMASGLSSGISPTMRTGSQVPTGLSSRGSRTTTTPLGQGSTILSRPTAGLNTQRRTSGSALNPVITPASETTSDRIAAARSALGNQLSSRFGIQSGGGEAAPPALRPGVAPDSAMATNPEVENP